MNKKLIILIVAIILVVVAGIVIYLVSTSSSKNNEVNNQEPTIDNEIPTDDEQEGNNEEEETDPTGSKIGIIYFSATGTTESVAGYIEDATNGDLIEIVPEDPYTSADLNYNNDDCRANREQNNSSSRPEIANSINVQDYDVIYLGFPIWWGDVPKIILTFLDNYDLSGKTVIPFCTSGGSGISTSMRTLRNYNSNVNWIDGSRLSNSQSSVTSWVNGLNY